MHKRTVPVDRRKKSVTVRYAVADDEESILACLNSAFGLYRKEYTREAYADTVLDCRTLKIRLREMSVLVALYGEQVVGTVAFAATGDEGHLRGMAVRPEYQGTGVARILLETAVTALHQVGCRVVSLDTTEPLKRATRFYRRAGFARSGKVVDFFGMRLHEYIKTL